MSVRALLRTKPGGVITVESTAGVGKVAQLLVDNRIGGLAVVDAEGALVGFVSERDVVEAVNTPSPSLADLGVGAVMRSPAPTCGMDDAVQGVMRRMTQDRLRHLVVVDEGRIVGVISVGDIVKHRLEELETEAGVLRDYVAGQRAMR